MYNTYIRSLLNGHGFNPMFSPDGGGGSGGEGGQGGSGGEGGEGGQGGSGNGNPSNSLDELLKDAEFKKQYEEKLKEQLGNRMKKFENVDLDEYKRLKEEADKKKQEEMTDLEKAQAEVERLKQQTAAIEAREADLAVKEYAISNGYDPKLIARLINKSGIKKGDNGEFEGIKEAVEAVQTEFPQLFQEGNGGEGEGGNQGGFKLPNQKGNNPPKKGGYDAGKARALARHGKQ